ncbi:trans-aconitate 2-methyltransferase [mine drainage metagenome]|uniref:Trans-aconitate 2-methyltransferase n=1 Tax=mine drainage metagenome TaxID=410659 RepID=A0A1J5SUY0_9ZZZZ
MPEDEVSQRTLGHYERNAESFWERTRDHDVAQNIAAMLRHIEGEAPFTILDFGCGPGRDLQALRQLGHRAVGLEGCAGFVAMARAHAGCEVLHQDFLGLSLPPAHFDAVFANASLFHVPSRDIRRVLTELSNCLKPAGVLFSSNPRGADEEGWQGERYGVRYREDTWRGILFDAGYTELEHYYRPEGLPREQQSWFAGVWRKSA